MKTYAFKLQFLFVDVVSFLFSFILIPFSLFIQSYSNHRIYMGFGEATFDENI